MLSTLLLLVVEVVVLETIMDLGVVLVDLGLVVDFR
jgi:hypothetical protein